MILFGKKAKNRSTETEEQKAARKQAEKEAAIAAYKEKRQLTLKRFFEIAGLPFPEKFEALADHPVTDFTADPRRLTPDSVFMYWQVGPLSSGYAEDPLERAVSTGCLCIITNEPCDFENTLLITDTNEDGYSIITDAYIRASHYIRSIHKSKVIALTGSVGKTSTKEMIEAVLRAHYKNPLVSKGNNNSMFSITRNIQKLKRPTNVYLQEVGAFAPRTIEISAKQLEADMAVYTNIGVSHVESYGSREELAKDKLSLSTYGKPDGLAFVNYDDEILMSHPFTQKVITYSLRNEEADYYAKNIEKTEEAGLRFTIVDKLSGEEHNAEVFVPGEHNVLNAVVAYAVGRALKLKPEEILAGIAEYRPSGMRQNIIHPCGYHIFADCYNSSLLAIENTLAAMDDIPVANGGRRIAVLGDILALGDISEETHHQIAGVLAKHKVDLLLAYGINIRLTVEDAAKLGIESKYFADRQKLEDEIRAVVKPEDLVLFKASHAVNLGSSIDRLFGTDINESSSIAHKQFRLETRGDFEYYIFETSASIKTYLGTDAKVEIPSSIEAEVTDELRETDLKRTLAVEKIGKTAFRNNQYVKEVVLPTSVIRIRDGAFKGSSIVHFEGSDNLLSIGDEAFADCPNLETVKISRNTAEIGKKVLENSPNAVLQYK
ncbi:uDP-N-acetylmuramoyl-tripeptide--D-alanyl-D-alanine ligase [Firmicutes bacterium CAG:238]|nr:uDP-N-acetylmuramoyl-tripeptide--D-alanyl-D-alanine ligase [Firmicutes bacterium CAG:238]